MTLEDALGRPIEDLEDAVIAHKAFGYVKHAGEDFEGGRERAIEDIDSMSNSEFLNLLNIGLSTLKDRNLI